MKYTVLLLYIHELLFLGHHGQQHFWQCYNVSIIKGLLFMQHDIIVSIAKLKYLYSYKQ